MLPHSCPWISSFAHGPTRCRIAPLRSEPGSRDDRASMENAFKEVTQRLTGRQMQPSASPMRTDAPPRYADRLLASQALTGGYCSP